MNISTMIEKKPLGLLRLLMLVVCLSAKGQSLDVFLIYRNSPKDFLINENLKTLSFEEAVSTFCTKNYLYCSNLYKYYNKEGYFNETMLSTAHNPRFLSNQSSLNVSLQPPKKRQVNQGARGLLELFELAVCIIAAIFIEVIPLVFQHIRRHGRHLRGLHFLSLSRIILKCYNFCLHHHAYFPRWPALRNWRRCFVCKRAKTKGTDNLALITVQDEWLILIKFCGTSLVKVVRNDSDRKSDNSNLWRRAKQHLAFTLNYLLKKFFGSHTEKDIEGNATTSTEFQRIVLPEKILIQTICIYYIKSGGARTANHQKIVHIERSEADASHKFTDNAYEIIPIPLPEERKLDDFSCKAKEECCCCNYFCYDCHYRCDWQCCCCCCSDCVCCYCCCCCYCNKENLCYQLRKWEHQLCDASCCKDCKVCCDIRGTRTESSNFLMIKQALSRFVDGVIQGGNQMAFQGEFGFSPGVCVRRIRHAWQKTIQSFSDCYHKSSWRNFLAYNRNRRHHISSYHRNPLNSKVEHSITVQMSSNDQKIKTNNLCKFFCNNRKRQRRRRRRRKRISSQDCQSACRNSVTDVPLLIAVKIFLRRKTLWRFSRIDTYKDIKPIFLKLKHALHTIINKPTQRSLQSRKIVRWHRKQIYLRRNSRRPNIAWLFIGLVWLDSSQIVGSSFFQNKNQQRLFKDTAASIPTKVLSVLPSLQKFMPVNEKTDIHDHFTNCELAAMRRKQMEGPTYRVTRDHLRSLKPSPFINIAAAGKRQARKLISEIEGENNLLSDKTRLESIKRQILSKLGMTRRPRVSHQLPKQIIWDTLYRADSIGNIIQKFESNFSKPDLFDENVFKQHSIKKYSLAKTNNKSKRFKNFTGSKAFDSTYLTDITTEEEADFKSYNPLYFEEKDLNSEFSDRANFVDDSYGFAQTEEEKSYEFEDEDYFGRIQEVIFFAERGQYNNHHQLTEFTLKFEKVAPHQLHIRSATLYLNIDYQLTNNNKDSARPKRTENDHMKIWIFKLSSGGDTGQSRENVLQFYGSFNVNLNELGWQKFDLTEAVKDWLLTDFGNRLQLLIDCTGCCNKYKIHLFNNTIPGKQGRDEKQLGKHNRLIKHSLEDRKSMQNHPWIKSNVTKAMPKKTQRIRKSTDSRSHRRNDTYNNPRIPFLVIQTEIRRARRVRRRVLDCSGALYGQCCKESFYVSFKALGWDDWIIAPRGYFANYCRGDCAGPFRTPDTFQSFHAHFIEEYRKMGLLNGMRPCCSPVKFSSMSLIYYGDDGIIKRDLPKMVVDECGCP